MLQVGAQSFTSLAGAQRRVAGLAAAVAGEGRRLGVRAAARVIADEAIRRVPRGRGVPTVPTVTRGGEQPTREHLADTIGIREEQHVIGPGGATRYGVGTDDPRGLYLEFGTKPHEIRPRYARALWGPGMAHPVARVSHPGSPARPWLKPAADAKAAEAAAAFAAQITQMARFLGQGGA